MKVIKYNLCTTVNCGTVEDPLWEEVLSPVTMGWNEVNEEIAKREAYNGEYVIEDDEQPEPEPEPVQESVSWDELAKALQEGVDSI